MCNLCLLLSPNDSLYVCFIYILMQAIFFLIVVDRVIYLCSFATWKVIFYLFNLVLFTYVVTQYAWHMDTSRRNTAGLALRAIYLTKVISLSLQAIQIRYGVPHMSTLYRQFLTSKVSRVNYLGYRLYRALPFLYELRSVLDWSCTTTSLTMYDWLKVSYIKVLVCVCPGCHHITRSILALLSAFLDTCTNVMMLWKNLGAYL